MKAESEPKSDTWRNTLLRWSGILGFIVLLPLLVAYVGSYVHLSRRGMREAQMSGLKFYFYVPLEEVAASRGNVPRHYRLVEVYRPINWIDRTFFGGSHPCTGVTWSLSGRPEDE
jgi:hypothetical protein